MRNRLGWLDGAQIDEGYYWKEIKVVACFAFCDGLSVIIVRVTLITAMS